ncbi:MAG: hypothetical protein D8M58_22145 [Calditrichaeota bacterium]|nr:MAG: hypothetical protein DWQ03_08700 [Calditrichota bacterium]MBL1208115.1 hypothetical protein [Calditrichota bacterium]NOG47953.1 PorV/PorQ family protein [Calditrichota bacterium]
MKTLLKNILLCLLLLQVSIGWAQKVGTTSFQFLKVLTDARATAMGEAYSSVATGSDAVFWNPARLTYVKGTDLAASYMDYFLDVKHFSFSAASTIGDVGTFGIFGTVTDFGEIPVATVDRLGFIGDVYNPGLTGETIQPSAFVFGVSYARDMTDKFSFGITVKYGKEDLVAASEDIIMYDAGINYKTGYKSIEIAASIRHFGPEVKFVKEKYPLPQTFNIGFSSYLIGSNDPLLTSIEGQSLLFAFDIVQPRDYDQQYNLGLEYGFNDMFFLRGGYKLNYDEESFALGLGIKYDSYRIDYSYNDYGEFLDSVQRFTIGFGL